MRRADPDRFLTALFAPLDRRETLFALYAFNHELARAWEVTSQPTLALIRLQWWREVVEGVAKPHEVASPLLAEMSAGRLEVADLLALIDGREREADGLATLADWQRYLDATAGALAVTAGRALAAETAMLPTLQGLGTAYGVAGLLRSRSLRQRMGRPVPEDAAGLAAWGASLVRVRRRLPRRIVAAGLVGVLARRDLATDQSGPRGLGDRLAVVVAAATARM